MKLEIIVHEAVEVSLDVDIQQVEITEKDKVLEIAV